MENSIVQFLLKHKEEKAVSFHMPGHKGSGIYKRYGYDNFIENMVDCDITEIEGADNLFHADGIIAGVMERYGKLYDVRKSYLLVNGTSCGLITSIMASVKFGGKIIMARNCHKSIYNGVAMHGLTPVYVYPEIIEEFGISGQITPEEISKAIAENPDAEAVILPSPNYYGICSDIKEIARIVHKSNKILIVDQAHGAHLKFFENYLPMSAEDAGADLVVNSIHKTLASFTQSAVLNVNSERVDLWNLEDKLQMTESTSPSYLLMGSLEIACDMLEKYGKEAIGNWQKNLCKFYDNAKNIYGLDIIHAGINMDRTKINLDMSKLGIDGHRLEAMLIENHIYPELVTGNIVMCMSGIGNTESDFDKLHQVLDKISKENRKENLSEVMTKSRSCLSGIFEKPVAADFRSNAMIRENIELCNAEGRICAGAIIPYPPGIPLVCSGEIITRGIIEYVSELLEAGDTVMGIGGGNCISVWKQSVNQT